MTCPVLLVRGEEEVRESLALSKENLLAKDVEEAEEAVWECGRVILSSMRRLVMLRMGDEPADLETEGRLSSVVRSGVEEEEDRFDG